MGRAMEPIPISRKESLEGQKGMRGDVMQTRSSCMEPTPTDLPTDPLLVCYVGMARLADQWFVASPKSNASCIHMTDWLVGLATVKKSQREIRQS